MMWYSEVMSKRVYILSGIAFFIVVSLFLYFAVQVPAGRNSADFIAPSDASLTAKYIPPRWLAGHPQEHTVEQHIQQRYHKVRLEAVDLQKEFPDSALLPFEFEVTPEQTVTGEYEGILLTEYTYTGGAHGNTTYRYFNFRDGNSLTLIEYLEERGVQKEYVLTLVNEYLVRDGYETVETLNDIPWQVHQSNAENPIGIRFIFPPYAVAPFSAGTITYTY